MIRINHPSGTAGIDADPTDHIGAYLARGTWYEHDLLRDAQQRVHGPGLAIDVGAHVGGHSVWFALAMGLDVIAIEPNPASYARLANTVAANPAANVRTIPAAAGATPGNATLIPPSVGNSGTARIDVDGGPIPVLTLDSLDLTDVKLMKIDVEGMAPEVLEGAQRLLEEQSPIIYAEGDRAAIAAMLPPGYRWFGQYARTPTHGFIRDRRPMRLSAAIMAHPTREPEVTELQAALDRPVPVAWDPNPTPSPDPARRWVTGRQAWELHDPEADWHLVLQDDAVVCPDLLAGLEHALTELGPEGLVSAYSGAGRPDQKSVHRALGQAERRGYSWLSTWSLNWGVAIIAPVATIPDMLDWCSQPARSKRNYDLRIGQYYRDIQGWRTWYTHPSLVDHRDDIASLIGHGAGRIAHTMHTGSALDIDWSRHGGLTVTVPAEARRRHA